MKNDNVKFKIIFSTIIFFGFFSLAQTSLAAPSVSSVSGTMSDGQIITISGSGFGANGPNILVYDDFEKGTNGNTISASGPEIGSWDDIVGLVKYSTANKISGSLALRSDYHVDWQNYLQRNFPPTTRDFLVSYWALIPAGTNIPGEGTADGTNWKVVWFYYPDVMSNDIIFLQVLALDNNYISGDVSPYNKYINPGDVPLGYVTPWQKGVWKRVTGYVKERSDNTGAVTLFETNPTGHANPGTWKIVADTGVQTIYNGIYRSGVHFSAYGRTTNNSYPTFDDIYLAVGSNAQARVEIGNAATYAASTNLTILTPTSWSDSSIAATVRQGSFANGSAYLYVTDVNGAMNAVGYPVTIGGGSGDITPPTSPTGLSVQ